MMDKRNSTMSPKDPRGEPKVVYLGPDHIYDIQFEYDGGKYNPEAITEHPNAHKFYSLMEFQDAFNCGQISDQGYIIFNQ